MGYAKKKIFSFHYSATVTTNTVPKVRGVRVMMLNATFNNISVISWRSVLLVGKPGLMENIQAMVPDHESRLQSIQVINYSTIN
jgi:hypothetical protein